MNWKYTTHHGKSTNCEHGLGADELSAWLVSIISMLWYTHATSLVQAVHSSNVHQSIPSFLTCYGRSNRNACIPSMTCHSRFSWTALLFSSIHSYIKLLHHQMFTCMFGADKGSLSVFQHVNSLAMHLNMPLRLPGSPQSLPDGTIAQKAELKALIPHKTKVEARNQYRPNVQVHCLFFE